MRDTDEVLGWRGRKAHDRDGDKLGTIEEIYLDAESGNPQWAAVKTGLFGSKHTFVPLEGARPQDDDVVLDWPASVVKDAPRIDADGELSPAEEDRLYDHYERYDSPEHHGGGADDGATTSRGDDATADATAGDAARRGADQHDLDSTAGESARSGADQRDLDPTAGESARSGADQRDLDATGAKRSGDVPAAAEGATVPSGVGQGETAAPRARRSRIKRYITEELDADGNPVRRETRTEEVFE